MKKLMTLLVAVMMVFTMTNKVMAAEEPTKNDSITVTGVKQGEVLNLYKMMDLVVDNEYEPVAYKYTINSAWTAFFTGTGAGAAYVVIDATDSHVTWAEGKSTEPGSADMIAFGQAAATYAANLTAVQSKTVGEGVESVVFEGLADGYYLITSSLGTKALVDTTPDASAVTIAEKNPTDNITKTVKEDSAGTFGASNDAQIGDTVNFQSVITLMPYTRNVKVTDVMDAGLTYTTGTAKITGLTAGTDYTISESATGFVITFTETYLKSLESKTAATELTLTYDAVLNVGAVNTTPAIVGQTNKITLEYGNAQKVEKTTTTTTHKFEIYKHAEGKTPNLAGAEFQLKKGNTVVNLTKIDDNNYKVDPNGTVTNFVTNATGNIVIWGVDADSDYSLEEIAAPDGYNKLPSAVTVSVSADDKLVVDIPNESGAELPSTGGIGTTIFHVAGALLVLGAGIVLVSKKRANNN